MNEEEEKLQALRAILAAAKASWVINQRDEQLPPQFAVVERMIEDQQRYLDNPVSLAIHCMGLLAELPFVMLAVLVVSDKHLSEGTITTFDLSLDPNDPWRVIDSLRFFKLGKKDAEYLIEVLGDEEDWEQEMPEDLFALLKYAEDRSCTWVLIGPERGVNEDLPTYPIAR